MTALILAAWLLSNPEMLEQPYVAEPCTTDAECEALDATPIEFTLTEEK
jgi:hypothetical protein